MVNLEDLTSKHLPVIEDPQCQEAQEILTKLFGGLEVIVPQVASPSELGNFKLVCEKMITLYQENKTL